MRLPRVRFTIRRLMVFIVLASLVFTALIAVRKRRERLVALQLARAVMMNSQANQELAGLALIQYTEGVYKPEKKAIEGELAQAEFELKAAREDPQQLAGQRDILEQAQIKKRRFEQTKERTLKMLRSDFEKARAVFLARKAVYLSILSSGR